MVRVYPITPQSQFKNNSRATVPLRDSMSRDLQAFRKLYWKFLMFLEILDKINILLYLYVNNICLMDLSCEFAGLGTTFFDVLNASFFCVLLKNALFFYILF